MSRSPELSSLRSCTRRRRIRFLRSALCVTAPNLHHGSSSFKNRQRYVLVSSSLSVSSKSSTTANRRQRQQPRLRFQEPRHHTVATTLLTTSMNNRYNYCDLISSFIMFKLSCVRATFTPVATIMLCYMILNHASLIHMLLS